MENYRITDIKLMKLAIAGHACLIRVDTDQGVWGLGETYTSPGQREIIDECLKPKIVGENPLDVTRLVSKILYLSEGEQTFSGTIMCIIGGIEIALWDLAGKITGLPIYRLLGGKYRDKIRMYRTGAPMPGVIDLFDLAQCRDWAAEILAEGWTAVKAAGMGQIMALDPERCEPGHEPLLYRLSSKDLSRAEKIMSNIRKAFGDDIDIAYHCHGEMNYEDSLKLARRIAPYNPIWFEDPMPVYFSNSWVELTRNSPVPICMGEDLYNKHEFRPFIEQHGTDIVHIDIPKAGGLLEAKRIADMADTYYLSTSLHSSRSIIGTIAAVHVASTIRDFGLLERGGNVEGWQDMIIYQEPIIQNGYMKVPEAPGLGLELNTEGIKANLAKGEKYWE